MKKTLIFVFFLTIVLGIIFHKVTGAYYEERNRLNVWTEVRDKAQEYEAGFLCNATVTNFDAVKGEVTLRLAFSYYGEQILADDNFSLRSDFWLITNTVKGKTNETFKKGSTIPPQEVVITTEGVFSDYPWDEHKGLLVLQMGAAKDDVVYDVALNVTSALSGYQMTVEKPKASDVPTATSAAITVNRTPTVRGFSIFINSAMWLLALVILGIGVQILVGGRKPEINMLTFMAGMMFAFPAVRGLQPGIPPLGSVTDYYATFFAQGIAALGICMVGFSWIFRNPNS